MAARVAGLEQQMLEVRGDGGSGCFGRKSKEKFGDSKGGSRRTNRIVDDRGDGGP